MMHIDYFSGSVIDLKKNERTEERVLQCLRDDPKVSTWDMSENPWLCRIIKSLEGKGLIIEEKASYPWHIFKAIKNPGKGAGA